MIAYIFSLVLLLLPKISSAQVQGVGVFSLIDSAQSVVNLLTPLVFTCALLVFLWGLGRFVLSAGSDDARTEGRRLMFWGVIALFVASSVWGLVYFIAEGLGVSPESFLTF